MTTSEKLKISRFISMFYKAIIRTCKNLGIKHGYKAGIYTDMVLKSTIVISIRYI